MEGRREGKRELAKERMRKVVRKRRTEIKVERTGGNDEGGGGKGEEKGIGGICN
jgi:hypothetical protein